MRLGDFLRKSFFIRFFLFIIFSVCDIINHLIREVTYVMEFFTVSREKRPVRLCDDTRKFAWDSLNHVYGEDTAATPGVAMDDIDNFGTLPEIDKYDLAIRRIAEKAPVRICPGEKISGAATLGIAISHTVPFTYEGRTVLSSVSHLTIDFETVLKRGINGITADINNSLEKYNEPEKVRFLQSCLNVTESMKIWHGRYISALKDMPGYENNVRNLSRVPFEPARNFYEAVQSIWFTFAFVRLCGNWPGIGRIDYLLGDYLKKDLESGALTYDEAREILAHFFIKGCEWVKGGNYGSGDAQHYQNIVLAGSDGKGGDVTNEVSFLVLDIIEELGISDFPTSVRLNKNTSPKLLRRAAEVLRFGGGILAFYNEDLIIPSLVKYGYPEDEAWRFANDGCWEIQIPGRTFFSYMPFDSLRILQETTLDNYSGKVLFDNFEELLNRYESDLSDYVEKITEERRRCRFPQTEVPTSDWKWLPNMPCTVVSVFEGGCTEKGLSYLEGGPVYNVVSPHIGGFPDTVNSLYAIKKIVFDEKIVPFAEFMTVLASDWEGHEALRRKALSSYSYYGNDNDEADAVGAHVLGAFAAACRKQEGKCGYRFPAGVSTFGRQLEWASHRLASPHGHRKGEVLAPNCSPTPGSSREGATAIIRSYCKADLSEMVTGAALDLKLLPSNVSGEEGLEAIETLLRGFVSLGGCFVQPDVEDGEILRLAQEHPENYLTLSVRVSGWNARFVTLSKDWQDMIINENR